MAQQCVRSGLSLRLPLERLIHHLIVAVSENSGPSAVPATVRSPPRKWFEERRITFTTWNASPVSFAAGSSTLVTNSISWRTKSYSAKSTTNLQNQKVCQFVSTQRSRLNMIYTRNKLNKFINHQ